MNEISKSKLRKDLLKKRLEIEPTLNQLKSDQLCKNLVHWVQCQNAKSIFFYLPIRGEPDLNTLYSATKEQIKFSLPRISSLDGEMEFYAYDHQTKFIKNKFGIFEPDTQNSPSIPDENTIIIIPCIAVDQNGIRLGYGGGFFDRYLAAYPNSKKIGVCFEDFFVDELPHEYWDIRLNFVCTEKKFYTLN